MANPEESFTEKIIEHVKKYKMLYDLSHPLYRNIRIKNKAWGEIAKSLNIEGLEAEHIKKKWKNLRDNYAKHLRSEKMTTGQKSKIISRYKSWPWAQQMEPFRLSLQFAPTQSNNSGAGSSSEILESTQSESTQLDSTQLNSLTHSSVNSLEIQDENNSVINDDEVQMPANREPSNLVQGTQTRTEESEQKPVQQSNRKRKAAKLTHSSQPTGMDKILSYLQKRSNAEESDEIDKIFLGYAAAVKKLSVRRQTMVKFGVAKMLMEFELEQQAENAREVSPQTPTWSMSNISNSSSQSLSVVLPPEYVYDVSTNPQTETLRAPFSVAKNENFS